MNAPDLVPVTQAQFFAYMGPRDVHPCNEDRLYTNWRTPARVLLGRSTPGWASP